MSDAINVYSGDAKESDTIINADDPANNELIRQMISE